MLIDVPVLIPGRYVVRDYMGRPKVLNVTNQDIKNSVTQGNKQIQESLSHPVCWMHDPDAEPKYLSHKDPSYLVQRQIAEGYIGSVKKFYERDGKTYVVVDIPDAEDARQFQKVGRVSPSFVHNWMDEKGKVWKGISILHIGSTPSPVQRHLPRVSAYRKSSLSHAVCFSINIPTGSLVMADEKKEKEDKNIDTIKADDEGDAAQVAEAVELLKQSGTDLHLGEPKSWDEFLIALRAAVHTKGGGPNETDDDMDGEGAEGEETEAVGVPAFMSHYLPRIIELEEKSLRAEIKDLERKVDKGTVARLNLVLDKANFSNEPAKHFDKKGNFIKPAIVAQIEAYKLLPDKPFKASLSHTIPVAPPEEKAPKKSGEEEAAEKLVAFVKSKQSQ